MSKLIVLVWHPGDLWDRAKDDLPSRCNQIKEVEVVMAGREQEFVERLPDADILLCRPLPRQDFLKATKVRWIHYPSAGMDKLICEEMIQRDVLVTSSSGIHATPISEQVFGMMLMFARQIHRAMRFKEEKIWSRDLLIQSMTLLEGKTVGIVGMGNIGLGIARRAKAFDMSVVAVKRNVTEKPDYVDALWPPTSLPLLLQQSDFVVLVPPLTNETRGMIGEEQLSLMKPTAYLLNFGRGALVNEPALIRALQNKTIAGAGLDVAATEPLPKDSPLWEMENVILTPHTGGASPDYWERVNKLFVENLRRFLAGEKMLNLVDKRLGY